MTLVGPESPSEQARRVFQSFDPEGEVFITRDTHAVAELLMSHFSLLSPPAHLFNRLL